MPYRKLKPNLKCLEYNPRKKNRTSWNEHIMKALTKQHIKKMQDGRKKKTK